ncbi:cation diffusion facilitator family transporter [bacterium]|nr:cation diffusion facilitator family transporter [bacterium]
MIRRRRSQPCPAASDGLHRRGHGGQPAADRGQVHHRVRGQLRVAGRGRRPLVLRPRQRRRRRHRAEGGGAPPDRNHPYGHHNYETLGALAASLLLLVTGFVLGKEAVENLLAGVSTTPRWGALIAAIVSIIAKEAMARYTDRAGRIHNSPALITNAVHHRSDALSSLAAAIGITGARCGAPFLDSVAALVIAVWIVWIGWQLMKNNTDILMETRPGDEFVSQVHDVALSVEGVEAVTFLVVRPRGSVYLADIAIAVRPDMSVSEGHGLAHAVEDALREDVVRLIGVTVHVEPHTARGTIADGS